MMIECRTPLLRAVLMKLRNNHYSISGSSLRLFHLKNYVNTANRSQPCLQNNGSYRQIFLMKHPCRLFTSTKYSKKGEAKLRALDEIPEDYELIYKGPLNSYIYLAQSVALISMAGLIGIFIYKHFNGSLFVTFPIQLGSSAADIIGEIGSDSKEMYIYTISFLVFNAVLYRLTMKYPLRIYCRKNADAYTCVMNGLIPSLKYKINFSSADVRRSKFFVTTLIPWTSSFFKIHSKSVLLIDNHFRTPADFSLMTNEKNSI